jgi:hypothetical protein
VVGNREMMAYEGAIAGVLEGRVMRDEMSKGVWDIEILEACRQFFPEWER